MKFTSAYLTDVGKTRHHNEDACGVDEERGLFLVADGMGGHAAGEVASRMAVEVTRGHVAAGLKSRLAPARSPQSAGLGFHARLLEGALRAANEVIYTAAQESPDKHGMGTTIVAVLLHGNGFTVAHVGDSRLYRFRDGRLEALTRDHSVVAEQVAKGLISQADAEKAENKNVLSRALGVFPDVEIDVADHAARGGDLLLICTDGLTKMVPDTDLAPLLARGGDIPALCRDLVEESLRRGGLDNVTVALVRCEPTGVWKRLSGLIRSGVPTPKRR
jgi:protein phosphatase